METFAQDIVVNGDTVYLVSDEKPMEFSFDGATLTWVTDIDLGNIFVCAISTSMTRVEPISDTAPSTSCSAPTTPGPAMPACWRMAVSCA